MAACGVLVLGSVFFYDLGGFPVLLWDEGRQAVNALEMVQSATWLVTYYDGEPDGWSTKPPLTVWLMSASMRLLGYSEFAIRLPSALSGLATLVLLFVVCVRVLRDPVTGLAAGLVLASSVGFIGEHVARTGDHDALLALWITAYSLSFFLYVHAETDPVRRRYLIFATTAFVLGALTKSVAALLGLPALLAYGIAQQRLGPMLRSPAFYAATVSALVIIAGYYFAREQQQPGYVSAVVVSEWMRSLETVEGHEAPPWYYVRDLLTFKYVPWVYAFPFLAIAAVRSGRPRHRALARYALLMAGIYLLVISFSQTKLPWYDAPFYPAVALVAGIGAVEVGRAVVRHRLVAGSSMRRKGSVLILASLMLGAYLFVAYRVVYRHHGLLYPWSRSNPQLASGPYLEHVIRSRPDLRLTFVDERYDAFNGHLLFYASVARLEGHDVTLTASDSLVSAGEVVATCDAAVRGRLMQQYDTILLDSAAHCATMKVQERRAGP